VSHLRTIVAPVTALVAALALAPAASAVDYPPPSKPGNGANAKPKGPFRTLKVCKAKKSCFPRIQDAVNEARPGDTIKVAHGTYRESVKIKGAAKRFIKLIGDPKDPAKVVLEGKGKKLANGVQINGANQVTVNGFQAQHYTANGFFAVNVNGYTLTNLKAFLAGVYGVYAFNSIGGTISDSEAAWNNDAGFYIGQTPPQQPKPVRSIVTNITSYGNVLGWSGTNMRYVTISDSKFYNNGAGIVPNALDSEKYPPAEDNVITRNEVFWNNFNYWQGAPFKKSESTVSGEVPYPVGVGILLFGGHRNLVTQNKVYGNWLVGVGALQQLLLKDPQRDLVGNQITNNQLGLGGADLNGRDLFYDGNGSDNCFGDNAGVAVTAPENGSTFAACPFTGPNAFSAEAQSTAINWTVGDPTHQANWITHPHSPQAGITPLEHYAGGVK
jgi:hypothetical protein